MIGTKVKIETSSVLPQDGMDVMVDLHSRLSVGARLGIAQEMKNILAKGREYDVGNFINDTDFAKFYLSLFPSRKEAEQFILQLMQHRSESPYEASNALPSSNGQTPKTSGKNKWF